MSTEQVIVNETDTGPTLEESAEALGLDPVTGDPVATEEAAPEAPVEETPAEERPEWLPEKFEDAEALAKAYAELEAKQSQPDEEQQAEEATEEEAPSAGLDLEQYSDKYFENGALEDADFEALEAQGLSRDLVEQYIAGVEAVQAQSRATMLEAVGGEDQYNTMLEWAADNYSEAEIDTFNNVVNSGDPSTTKMAIENLQARYNSSGAASEPSRSITGEASGAASAYRSVAELTRDMADPRYHNDPAFRADVESKLSRSDIM